MPNLLILDGPQKGQTHFFPDQVALGDSAESQVLISSANPSGSVKAEIVEKRNGYVLRKKDDAISLSVNGEPVDECLLAHGNIVTVGDFMCVFNLGSDENVLFKEGPYVEESLKTSIFDPVKTEQEREQWYLLKLYHVSNLIASMSDLKGLLERLVDFFLKTFEGSSAAILINDDQMDDLRVSVYKAVEKGLSVEELQSEISDKKLNLVYKKRKAILWKSGNLGEKHLIAAPLAYQNECLGLIVLESSNPDMIRQHVLHLFGEIALLTANGIVNIRQHIERKEHARRLETLNKITVKLSSLMDSARIYREAAREVCSILKCTKSSILYLDSDGFIKVGYAVGIAKEIAQKITISYGDGLAGWSIKSGKPMVSSSIPSSLSPSGRKKYLTQSFLIVPIPIFKNTGKKVEIIGAICATDRLNKVPFSRYDREILTLIAGQVGIALINASLYEQATVDFLTRVCLRGFFFEKLKEIIEQIKRVGEPVSLLMIDLDFFKRVNDTHGHQIGDVVLKEIGHILNTSIREGDIAGRYGGEEFIILLKNTTYLVAIKIANRIRLAVEKYTFNEHHIPIRMTVSIGVAQYIPHESPDDLILRADRSLYQAKKSGRNQVC